MFGFLEDLVKVAATVVAAPVAVAADVITMGGAMTDQDKPYTAKVAEDLIDNVQNLTRPNK